MIYEELKLPLPIYDRYEKQYRFMKADVPNHTIVTRDMILPFQFIVNSVVTVEDITEWTIRQSDAARTVSYTLTSKTDKLELVETAAGKTYIIFKPSDIGLLMTPQVYHMEFVVDGERYYSEQFEVRCESPYWSDLQTAYTRLEWDNNGCDLGPIMYQTGFVARAYIDSVLHKETPSIEEEGDDDGAGNFIPSRQQYVDNLNLEDILPYYLADALVLMCMHRNVTLTTPNIAYSGKIKNIKPTVVQEEKAWLYRVALTFQQDSLYVATACCENIPLPVAESDTDSDACDTSVINLSIVEDAEGYVSASWNVIGNADRVKVEWSFANDVCPASGSFYLAESDGMTNYQFADVFAPGTISLTVTPQCLADDVATSGTAATESKTTANGPSCSTPPPPPEPGEPSGIVIVENNTTNITIYDVTGIPGFNPPPIPPQSGYDGVHSTFTTSPSIYVHFNEYFDGAAHARIYINGIEKYCHALTSNPLRLILFEAVADSDDISISVSSGLCS